jgi:F420H(2)-dependent quinone reductase
MPSPPKGPPPGSFGLKVMNRFTALNVWLYRRTGPHRRGDRQHQADCVGRSRRREERHEAHDPLVYTRDRLWPLVVDTYADFAVYQARTERKIPVVVLTPAG